MSPREDPGPIFLCRECTHFQECRSMCPYASWVNLMCSFGTHPPCSLRQYLEGKKKKKNNLRARSSGRQINPRRQRQTDFFEFKASLVYGKLPGHTHTRRGRGEDLLTCIWSSHIWLVWLVNKLQGSPIWRWDYKHTPLRPVFYMSARDDTQMLVFALQACNLLSHLPTPPRSF